MGAGTTVRTENAMKREKHRSEDRPLQEMGGGSMKYYVVGEVEITEQGWVPDYIRNVTGMVERRGGRYLARTSIVERLEGDRKLPQILVILEWPSKESAVAFFESEEYRPYRKSRSIGAKNEFLLAAGEDLAKAAHIPE